MTQPLQIAGKGGRPKRQFTDEEVQQIDTMASNNCHMDTIALALEIPLTTLVRRFGRVIKRKRAQGRIELRAKQVKLADNHPAMAIFLGKNELGQVDKQVIQTETAIPAITEPERKAREAAAKIYKLNRA